jgi:23S rRNA A2030 N6-methylase RlmJ
MVVVNPPFVLEEEMAVLLPALRDALGEDGASAQARWLTAK